VFLGLHQTLRWYFRTRRSCIKKPCRSSNLVDTFASVELGFKESESFAVGKAEVKTSLTSPCRLHETLSDNQLRFQLRTQVPDRPGAGRSSEERIVVRFPQPTEGEERSSTSLGDANCAFRQGVRLTLLRQNGGQTASENSSEQFSEFLFAACSAPCDELFT